MNIQKIQKWQKILEGQISEMTDILERRFIFQETKKIVQNNDSINKDNIFYDYFRINYIYAQIIQLSRILDQDPRTESFSNLLADIENNPEVFERNWRDEINKLVAPPQTLETFGNSLEEKTLTSDVVSEDKCKLLCTFAPIKKYRDKEIAHKQAKGKKPNLTFEKLDEFIDLIHGRILVYASFLHGSGYPENGLLPVIQYDWQEIFRTPWIIDDKK